MFEYAGDCKNESVKNKLENTASPWHLLHVKKGHDLLARLDTESMLQLLYGLLSLESDDCSKLTPCSNATLP